VSIAALKPNIIIGNALPATRGKHYPLNPQPSNSLNTNLSHDQSIA